MLPATDPTVRAFLASSMVAEVATVSPRGRPFVTPLWFVVDAGVVWVTTAAGSRAATNVGRQPEVTLLLTGERCARAGEALRLRGTATCHRGLPPWRVLMRIAIKYYLAPAALAVELSNVGKWRLRARYYAQPKGGAGHLRIVPTGGELLPRP